MEDQQLPESDRDPERFARVAGRIDGYNSDDPGGEALPHAQAVAGWIERLRPDASLALRLAGHAHHIGRWKIPRADYPRNRPGYLRWRKDLQGFHAAEAASLLAEGGYSAALIERVRALITKQDLTDPDTQTLEDALCLAFMERQLADFQTRHDDAKLQRILRKTWAKMSPQGQHAALALSLPQAVRALLERSLEG